jgi:DNA-binding NarL/FixJ family response regulator
VLFSVGLYSLIFARKNQRVISLYLVEDHHDIRKHFELLLQGETDFRCRAFRTAEDALSYLKVESPDIILMDINLPGMSGIDATQLITEKCSSIQVMMLTVYEDDEKIFRALKAGASSYMLKKTKPTELIEAIGQLKKGFSPMSGEIARKVVTYFNKQPSPMIQPEDALSEREYEILHLLSQGLRNKEIAERLSITLNTVKAHLYKVYQKLHVQTRVEAMNKMNGKKRDYLKIKIPGNKPEC